MATVRRARYDRTNGKRVPKKIPNHRKIPSNVQRNSVSDISNPLAFTDCEKRAKTFHTALNNKNNKTNFVADRSREIGRFTTFRYQCPRIIANSEPESIKPPKINTKMEIRSAFIKCPTIRAIKIVPTIEGMVTTQLAAHGFPQKKSVMAKREISQANPATMRDRSNPNEKVNSIPPVAAESARLRTNR
jgi:hypothetical protein